MSFSFSEVDLQELPPMRVICARVISANPEDEVIKLVHEWLKDHGLSAEGKRSFGFDTPVSRAEADSGLRGYEFGVEIPDSVLADEGLKVRTYGGGMYAVMRIFNAFEEPFTAIPAGWQKLSEWGHANLEWKPSWYLCYEEVSPGKQGPDLILYLNMVKRT